MTNIPYSIDWKGHRVAPSGNSVEGGEIFRGVECMVLLLLPYPRYLNVILEIWVLYLGTLVCNQDFPDSVGELHGDWLVFAEFASVVVEFCERENVARDGFKIGVAVLDFDDEGDGHVRTVVSAEPGLEAGGPEEAASLRDGPEGAAQNGACAGAVEPHAKPFLSHSHGDEFNSIRASSLIACEFFGI